MKIEEIASVAYKITMVQTELDDLFKDLLSAKKTDYPFYSTALFEEIRKL